MKETLKSPFPYFGGKRKIADQVWERFGKVANYVEPFFGSGAMLLARPGEPSTETVNDADGFVANFWRALQKEPEQVAHFADWPVNENDLHARHAWLVGQKDSMQSRLEGDPDWFDAKIAGWWVFGMACWIGGGFCSGKGPWHVVDGKLVLTESNGAGTQRKLIHVGDQGQGINRQLIHVGRGRGVNRKRVQLGGFSETGVNAKENLISYMNQLADRMRNVRVCCGDWSRVTGPCVTCGHGLTAVFLDPPYADTANRAEVYRVDCDQIAHAVREWAIAEGKNPLMRIALCGYEGEHIMPDDWQCQAWNAGAGYSHDGGRDNNGKKERVWFSPHCENANQGKLI